MIALGAVLGETRPHLPPRALAVLAVPQTPWGWAAVYAPLLVLGFILGLSGIPASERRALVTRGDDYRRYQRSTSAFIPWPPR